MDLMLHVQTKHGVEIFEELLSPPPASTKTLEAAATSVSGGDNGPGMGLNGKHGVENEL